VEVVEAAAATRLHLQLPFPVVVVEAVRHGLMFGTTLPTSAVRNRIPLVLLERLERQEPEAAAVTVGKAAIAPSAEMYLRLYRRRMAAVGGLVAQHPRRPLAVEGRGFLVLAVMRQPVQAARLETTEALLAAAVRQRGRPIWAVVGEVAQAMQALRVTQVVHLLRAVAVAAQVVEKQRHQPTAQVVQAAKTEPQFLMLLQAAPTLVLGHSLAVAPPWVLQGLVALAEALMQQPLTLVVTAASPAAVLEAVVPLLLVAPQVLVARAALASSSCGAIDADLTG